MNKLQYRWKVRAGSPRELQWELYQFLASKGFSFEGPYEPLKLEQTPIEGTATFESTIEGHRDFHGRSLWRLILGIIFCMTIVLIALGIWLIRKSKYTLVDIFTLKVEGEAYRASARTQDPHRAQSEVQDVASNARVILEADLRFLRAGKVKKVKVKPEWEELQMAEFNQLRDELDKLIPKIVLPRAIEDSELPEST